MNLLHKKEASVVEASCAMMHIVPDIVYPDA